MRTPAAMLCRMARLIDGVSSSQQQSKAPAESACVHIRSSGGWCVRTISMSSCLIVDSVSAKTDRNAYLDLLKVDGSMVIVGLPERQHAIGPFLFLVDFTAAWLRHRRHPRDAGDTRFLRPAQYHIRSRGYPDPESERGLRACS